MDKKTQAILATIVSASPKGEYAIIEREELLQSIPQELMPTVEDLEGIIRELIATDFITLKYKDSDVFCVSASEKAIVIASTEDMILPTFVAEKMPEKRVRGIGAKVFFASLSGSIIGTGIVAGVLMLLGVI
ncbi:MAG: hypothetical protein R3Y23_00270 [Bacillota bacterium]